MKPRHLTEQQFVALVKRRDTDTVQGDGLTGTASKDVLSPPARRDASARYKSTWETAYAHYLALEQYTGHIRAWWYEPFSLWLPGKVRYTPDFMVEMSTGELEIIEVKGWSRNRRDGMTRLRVASAIFSCFTWRLVYRTKGGGWDGEYV